MNKKYIQTLALLIFTSGFMFGCTKGADKSNSTESTATVTTSTESGTSQSLSDSSALPEASASASPGAPPQGPDLSVDANGLSHAVAVVKTSKGSFKFKFYAKDAPKTVARFVELVQSKFYDGQSFHRVVPGFVIQTGDPKSRNKSDPTVGSGGSGVKQKAEFNSRKHVRGTVAMARAADPDSADSQFYVSLGSYPHLDEKYTVFGQVVDYGEKVGDKDVIDRIAVGDDLVQISIE
jgi:cyclophilin family peptidyl-prolyl cis-trans isomerase